MAIPTAQDVYDFLEDYAIDNTKITETWIEKRRDNYIIPAVEYTTRQSIRQITDYTEYLSGNGKRIMVLARRPVFEVKEITYISADNNLTNLLASILLDGPRGILVTRGNYVEGLIQRSFLKGQKNIKVTYSAGFDALVDGNGREALDLKEAIIMLVAAELLIHVGARTGGGALTQKEWGRNFGPLGKYSDRISYLQGGAMNIIMRYSTGVKGT